MGKSRNSRVKKAKLAREEQCTLEGCRARWSHLSEECRLGKEKRKAVAKQTVGEPGRSETAPVPQSTAGSKSVRNDGKLIPKEVRPEGGVIASIVWSPRLIRVRVVQFDFQLSRRKWLQNHVRKKRLAPLLRTRQLIHQRE